MNKTTHANFPYRGVAVALLAILFFIVSISIMVRGIEFSLISNTPQCFDCETIYKVCKDSAMSLAQAQTAIRFYDINIRELTREYDFGQYRAINVTTQEPIYGWVRHNLTCGGSSVIENLSYYCTTTGGNGTSTSITPYAGIENGIPYIQEWGQTGLNSVTRTKTQYQKFASLAAVANGFKNADVGTCWNISIKGKLKPGENVDNVVCIGERCFTEWAWWNNTFFYRVNVTVNTTVLENLTNFPVGIKLDTASLIAAGKMKSNCSDIRVTNSTDSEIPHEIENCNSSYSVVWAKPAFLHDRTQNNTLILYYGSPNATDNQDPATLWAEFAGVWHGSNFLDSLGVNNLAGRGDANITYNQSRCKYGGCFVSEANGYLNTTDTGISIGAGNISMRAWGWKSKAANNYDVIFIQGKPGTGNQNQLYYGTGTLCADPWGGGGSCISQSEGLAANLNYYTYIGGATTMMLYFNITASSPSTYTRNIISRQVAIMAHETGGNQWGGGGAAAVDEVRIENRIRSANWIAAEYGALVILQNETPFCTANWSCDSYAECNSSNISACLSVEDLNVCGEPFGGDLSDYDVACIWNNPPTWKQYPPNITTSENNFTEALNFTDIEGDVTNFTINGTFSGTLQFEKLILSAILNETFFRWFEVNVSDDNGTASGLFWVNFTCIPSYSCAAFLACNISNISACLSVVDSHCGVAYPGNLSDYDLNCTYVPPAAPTTASAAGSWKDVNTTQGGIFLFICVFVWLALLAITIWYRNFATAALFWFIGIGIGLLLFQVSNIGGIGFILLDCLIFITIGVL